MRHVAIAKENSPAGRRYNRLTFELIRRWLDEKTSQRHKVMEEIEAFSNSTLKTYFGTDVTVELQRLKIDQQDLPVNPTPTPVRSLFSRNTKPSDAPETRVVIASMLSPRQKGLSLKQKVGFSVSGLGIFITSAVESDFAAVYDIYDRGQGRRLVRMELPGLIKGKDFKIVPDFALNKLIIEGEKKKWEEGDEPAPPATPSHTTIPVISPHNSGVVSASSSTSSLSTEETKTEGEGEAESEGEKEKQKEETPAPTPAPTAAPASEEAPPKLHEVTVDSYGRKYGRFRAVIDLLEELPGGGHMVYRRDGEITFDNGLLYIPLRAERPKQEEW
jgi:HSP20 family molecular chaperone IbpA